jgi:hypothetical protein
MSGHNEVEKLSVWNVIEEEMKKFETSTGFRGPCEMVVAVGQKP